MSRAKQDAIGQEVSGPYQRYAYEAAVSTAGTAAGSAAAFAVVPNFVSIFVDLDSWIGESAAIVGTNGTGAEGGRIFVAARERRVVPWASTGFFVVNAVAGEKPMARVEGWI